MPEEDSHLSDLACSQAHGPQPPSAASPSSFVVVATFPERDATFIKLLAQKLTAQPEVVALLASGSGQPAMVFAQTPGMKSNMGQLLKEVLAKLGGRGGGSADMAQGGLPAAVDPKQIETILHETAANLKAA